MREDVPRCLQTGERAPRDFSAGTPSLLCAVRGDPGILPAMVAHHGLLTGDDILDLHAAVLSTGLGDSRAALLAGIDLGFVGRLRKANSPSAELLLDLRALSASGTLADGTVPLAQWLGNALALLGPRRQAVLFQAALEKCLTAAHSAAGGPRALPATVDVRLYNLAAACEWMLVATPAATVLHVIGELRTRLQAQPWLRRDVPRPSAAYKIHCYLSETESEPLSPHQTIAELLLASSQWVPLSLNVEWYRVFRGAPRKFR